MKRQSWTNEKLFNRLIVNKSKSTYYENISELRKRPTKEVHDRAIQLCKSSDDKEKIIGIDVLAQLGVKIRLKQRKTLDIYFWLLEQSQNYKVLDSILSGIGHNNTELSSQEINTLISFKSHTYSVVRFSLVFALMGVENENAIMTLIDLSRDKHHDVRNWATFSLGTQIEKTSQDILNALFLRTKDIHEETRLEAIVGLARRNDPRTSDLIFQELDKKEHGTLLFEAIEILNNKSFLPSLEKTLEEVKLENDVKKHWIKTLESTIETLRGASKNE